MSIICVILGLNVYVIFLYKREWLLQTRSFLTLLTFNCLLFIVGHMLINHAVGNRNLVAALKIPAPQQLLFGGLLIIYRGMFNRDPEDTWHSMDWKKMKDGTFNFIFWSSSVIPTLL